MNTKRRKRIRSESDVDGCWILVTGCWSLLIHAEVRIK